MKVTHRYQRFLALSPVGWTSIDQASNFGQTNFGEWKFIYLRRCIVFPRCERSCSTHSERFESELEHESGWREIELIKVATETYNGRIDALKYRLQRQQFMLFTGRYLEVSPVSRLQTWLVTGKCHFFAHRTWYFREVGGQFFCLSYASDVWSSTTKISNVSQREIRISRRILNQWNEIRGELLIKT